MEWYQRRPWDPMSMTPGRQPLQVQNWWRERDQRDALTWLQQQAELAWRSSLARVDETDASSTAVEIDTEHACSQQARRAALQALDEYRASRGPGSYEPQQFTWTFRCPDRGCGWAGVSDHDDGPCPRCLAAERTTAPLKFPTFMDKVCEVCFDNQVEDWFYFCHTCLKCTWKRRCCLDARGVRTECVDVRALKRGQQRRT